MRADVVNGLGAMMADGKISAETAMEIVQLFYDGKEALHKALCEAVEGAKIAAAPEPLTPSELDDIKALEILVLCSLVDKLVEQVKAKEITIGRAADLLSLFKRRFLDGDDRD